MVWLYIFASINALPPMHLFVGNNSDKHCAHARTHIHDSFGLVLASLLGFIYAMSRTLVALIFFFSPTILLIVSAHWFACQFFVMHLIFIILNWYVRITNLFIKFINRNVFGCGYAEGMILCVFTIHWQLWLHAKLMVDHPFGFMFKLINVRT